MTHAVASNRPTVGGDGNRVPAQDDGDVGNEQGKNSWLPDVVRRIQPLGINARMRALEGKQHPFGAARYVPAGP